MTAIRIGALVFAALIVSFAAGPVRAQEATVRIDNFAFAPAETKSPNLSRPLSKITKAKLKMRKLTKSRPYRDFFRLGR